MPPPAHGAEYERLREVYDRKRNWPRWGPYLAERQWGTVREDYSDDANTWEYFTHDHARSRVYRWGEDGLLGLTDRHCRLCFAVALWNGKDSILKERLFGLSGKGNHGEDVKEQYFYLDSTPTHSYMKCLYKYPQQAFPYQELVEENKRRTRKDPEYELIDTKIFDNNEYFDIFVEYAKRDVNDILIRITVANRSDKSAKLHLLPTLFFRNTWAWTSQIEKEPFRPKIERQDGENILRIEHCHLEPFAFDINPMDGTDDQVPEVLFTENETNLKKLYNMKNEYPYVKDAFHEYIVNGNKDAVNPLPQGTKVALHYQFNVDANSSQILHLRLYCLADTGNMPQKLNREEYNKVFDERKQEADQFYESIYAGELTDDEKNIIRQAYAGLLHTKQFYHYIVKHWIDGEEKYLMPAFPEKRLQTVKNSAWQHMWCRDVLSMPDKWEYPWVASWDLAFHVIPFAHIDPDFAKSQLLLIMREWYMSANGQIMAYELNLDDVNPPVLAWAAWRVYKISAVSKERRDRDFLHSVFLKLLLNFTWWVNRKDPYNKNIFSGGFLGLDNVGVFDRNKILPNSMEMHQSDGTSWIAFFALTMMNIALELAGGKDELPMNGAFQDMSSKFLEHFIYIVDAINKFGGKKNGCKYHRFFGDSWKIECPTRSGQMMSLIEVSREITRRITNIFKCDDQGRRACHGDDIRFQKDPYWRDLVLFHEYFHGDTGLGLGASHQTGWTAVVIRHIEDMAQLRANNSKEKNE
ncbi:unnamed protein product [Rotaria sordida]|uniref:Mannosylglycerate hydrolase MGH1-like glycoside hydrolase domain-containing protein n=1 Tax=Rotaria sordida TaxID=392033 RepID=A0A819RGD9_9BILA|nr:unnamed protein product [Rotaria sordida]CAF4051926.1 unnamed protein product [Rotaria sordida]